MTGITMITATATLILVAPMWFVSAETSQGQPSTTLPATSSLSALFPNCHPDFVNISTKIYTKKDWDASDVGVASVAHLCREIMNNPSVISDAENNLYDSYPSKLLSPLFEELGKPTCYFDANRIPSLFFEYGTCQVDPIAEEQCKAKNTALRCETTTSQRFTMRRKKGGSHCDSSRLCLSNGRFVFDDDCCQWAMVVESAAIQGYTCKYIPH